MKVSVDLSLCNGHGECVMEAPGVFALADDADVVTIVEGEPSEDVRGDVERAASLCPVAAIVIEG